MGAFRTVGLGAFAAGVLVGGVGQVAPPFHLLGHETAQIVSVVATLLAMPLGARLRDRLAPGLALVVGSTGVLGFGLGLQAVTALANAAVHACDTTGTGAFFWSTWIPLGVFGLAFGMATHRRSVRARIGLVVALAVGALVHDGIQALFGVRVVDPFLGVPVLFDQRADLQLHGLHLTSRAWFLLVGLSIAAVHAVRSGASRGLLGVTVLPLVLWTLFGSDTTGMGPTRSAMLASLDGVRRSEHFVFRYRLLGPAAGRMPQIEAEAELQYSELAAWLGLEEDVTVEVLLFDDEDHLWEITGLRNAHAGPRRTAMIWWDPFDETLAHELVHTVHDELSWNPLLLLQPGMLEGTAMAWNDGYGRSPDSHADIAAASAAGHLPPATQIFHPLGFLRLNEGNAYRFAGSFMGFVRLTYGREAFRSVQRDLDWVGATGKSLDELDAEWRAFLTRVEVEPLRAARARDRFDPALAPGIYERTCPRLGPLEPATENVARAMLDADPRGAAALYATLPGERWMRARVGALQQAGLHREALQVLKQVTKPAEIDRQLADLQLTIHSRLALAVELDTPMAWQRLYEAFGRRRELEVPDADRLDLERLLAGTWRRELGRALLASGQRRRSIPLALLLELAADHPEEPALRWLLAERGAILPTWRGASARAGAGRDRLVQGVELWRRAERCPSDLDVGGIYAGLVDVELCKSAATWVGLVRLTCSGELPAWRLEALEHRVERAGCGAPRGR